MPLDSQSPLPSSLRITIARASGDRRDDGQAVAFLHWGGFFLQVTNVLVVEINVDESAQLPVIGVKMAFQLAVLGDEGIQRLAHGGGAHLHAGALAGIRPQRSGNMHLHLCPLDVSGYRFDTSMVNRSSFALRHGHSILDLNPLVNEALLFF